jgi:hypothetical protein
LVIVVCSARLALAALPVFSFEIRPPSAVIACFVVTWMTRKNQKMYFFRDRSGRTTDGLTANRSQLTLSGTKGCTDYPTLAMTAHQ